MVKWLGKQYRSIYRKIQSFLTRHEPGIDFLPNDRLNKINREELLKVHNSLISSKDTVHKLLVERFKNYLHEIITGSYSIIANDVKSHVSEECVNNYLFPAILGCLRVNCKEFIDTAMEAHHADPIIKIKYAKDDGSNTKH